MIKMRTAATALALALPLSAVAACGAGGGSDAKEVVVYTADGLNDGSGSYYKTVAKDFEKSTGIDVKIVEAGSGEILQRAVQEKNNPQADILVTLPPFMQKADKGGLLAKYTPAGTEAVDAANKSSDGTYYTLVDNYLCLIHNTKKLPTAPATFKDLLGSDLKGKLQYSTPGVAGDGTAFLVLGSELESDATTYFTDLQDNNVGPSDSTGQLASKVDRGELLVANGDVQMNYAQTKSMPNLGIFFPEDSSGKPTTLSLPYQAGLLGDAPHSANAKKFLDYLYDTPAQEMTMTVAGGFPARSDVKPTGQQASDLEKIMDGVTVLHPNWTKIAENLDKTIDAYNKATGTL